MKLRVIDLRKFIFTGKQEKFKPNTTLDAIQVDLFPDDKLAEVTEISTTVTKAVTTKTTVVRPNHKGRNKLPEHLRREEIILEPTEDVTGLTFVRNEVTEVLEYKQGELFVKKIIRPEYIKPTQDGLNAKRVIAPLPSMPIAKCIAGPSLLAHIMGSKFVDHLPIHRILEMFKRLKVIIDSSTVCGWLKQLEPIISTLYEAHKKEVLQTHSLSIDETPLKVQDDSKKNTTHQGYYWVYYNTLSKLVLFNYQKGRDGQCPKDMLCDYKGYIHVDGYGAYTQFENVAGITVTNCWAHARRKFIDAQNFDKPKTEEVLTLIAKLYEIEKVARENNYTPAQIKEARQEKSKPILAQIHATLKIQLTTTIPNSPLGKAIQYSLNRWNKLTTYTQDGFLPIDNNLVENSIRPIAIGRKNWLFAGSHGAAQRSAMLYSLFATCKLYNLDPIEWLIDVLSKINEHPNKMVHQLLPQNYAATLENK